MSVTTVLITPEKVTYSPKADKREPLDAYMNITKEIYKEKFNLIVGRKKNYLVYVDGILDGYCHSATFAMNIVRSMMSKKIDPKKKYKVVIKKVPQENMTKVYFYEQSEGWIYNREYLVNKFRIVEIPKIELKYLD